MRLRVVKLIALTTLREFIRTKEAVFWTYGFPVLMAIVLGLAFSRSAPEPIRVMVVESANAAALLDTLTQDPLIVARTAEDEEARRAVFRGDADLLLDGTPAAPTIVFDNTRTASRLAQLRVADLLQRRAGRTDAIAIASDSEANRFERYIDFLLPGLIGLNLLGAGMWGIGWNLVDMRTKNLLRRLVVAPMQRSEFLLGFLLSRLGLVVFDALAILVFGMWVFGVPMIGSWLVLLAVIVAGGVAFSGLGLVVASRARTNESISGLMNLVMMPMWLMSGSFFKTSNFPDYLSPLINILPLTHANDALRAVMLHGQGWAGVAPQLAFLAGFGLVTFAVALRIFRWT